MIPKWFSERAQIRYVWRHLRRTLKAIPLLQASPKFPLKRKILNHWGFSSWVRVRKVLQPKPAAFLVLVALFLISMTLPMAAEQIPVSRVALQTTQTRSDANTLDQQGRQRYAAAQYAEAAALWQQAISAFQLTGNSFRQAQTLSNFSLAHQQLGNWTDAEAAIQAALTLLDTPELKPSTEQSQLLAQAWDVQGRLQLSRGNAEAALSTWRQAAQLYEQLADFDRLTRNQINQAQALQMLGLYSQAQAQLTAATQILQNQPDSALKAIGLRSLGNVLRATGNLAESRQVLQQSLEVATAINNSQEVGEALLSLGSTAVVQQDTAAAIGFYQQASIHAILTAVPAQLRYLNLLLETHQLDAAQSSLRHIQTQIDRLPLSRTAVYARIDYAQSLMKLNHQNVEQAVGILVIALQQARSLQDIRAESYVIGTLGNLYEQMERWTEATTLTRQALVIAQRLDATDMTYQWQWQLGRLFRKQQDMTGAIAAYAQAVKNLQAIRYDLVNIDPDIQFSFRDKVEPVYRQFVDLLLQPHNGVEPSQDNIRLARTTIEALQLAELDNFFRAACLAPKQQLDTVVDQADPSAAVLYAMILSDRIEVILKLPQQPLRHYATFLPQSQVEETLESLRRNIAEPDALRQTQIQAQQVYDWLIQPGVAAMAQSQIKTLVFVLDGQLRNIPMAALYDGQQYLIEKYAVALSPSLQLFEPKPLQSVQLNALVMGLDQARHGFSRLPYVGNEVAQIQSEVRSQVLFNQQFTTQTFQAEINAQPFSIVHLATHGQFSSEADETFILAWDKPINVNELNTLLRTQDQQQQALELLVLSACETAAGDQRAALGLAGVAIRAGARSTVASLWSVNDESTAMLMNQFYQSLIKQTQPKTEALRHAQLSLLRTPEYQLPIFWAPYVLVGNWL
jgi:CHAT domain-containing protein